MPQIKNSSQRKWGVIISYLQIFSNVVIQLIYTPYVLNSLGKAEYGLYHTVASTINILSLLTLGFTSSYVRFFYLYKKRDDQDAISRLNGLFLLIFTILGSIALICGLFLTFNLKLVFADGLTSSEYATAKWLMLLCTINLAITFPSTVFSCIISANERFIFLKVLALIKAVVTPISTMIVLAFGYKSIAIILVTLIISIIIDLSYVYYVFAKLKYKFIFNNFEKGLFKSLFLFSFFIAINSIVDQINSNLGKVILGRVQGTEVVAVYSIGYSLYHYLAMFAMAIGGVFAPKINKIVTSTKDNPLLERQQLTGSFIKVGRLQYILLSLLTTGIIVFGKPFIFLWAGEGFDESYFVAVILAVSSIPTYIQTIGVEIQRAKNIHQFRSIVYIIMAAINVGLTFIFATNFGAIGASLGTAISFIVANGIIINIYYHFKCNVDILAFWKNILKISLGLIIPLGLGYLLNKFVNLYSWLILALFILLYVVVFFISMWFISFNKEEKQSIIGVFKKVFNGFKKLFKRKKPA